MAAYDLKNEEEVKEYIENLGIEYRFSCYSERKPSGCQLLGDYLEAIKSDFANAAKVYKMNCDQHNFGKSCHNYAAYNQLGKGLAQNHATAFKYFNRGCELNYPEACLLTGAVMCSGKGVPKDSAGAIKYLEKGCLANNAESCFYLSSIYFRGDRDEAKGEVVKRDMSLAFKFTEHGCRLGNMQACANLSQMYERGIGTAENPELAKKYRQVAINIRDQHVKQEETIKFG